MNNNIFTPRVNILPYEYPSLLAYKDAIRHSYWIHTEFNFTTDIDDFKTKITDDEREVIKRAMLAIAQIEVNVKTWESSLVANKCAHLRISRNISKLSNSSSNLMAKRKENQSRNTRQLQNVNRDGAR